MLGEPYHFADIPVDLEGNQPHVHIGDVFAVSGSSKRKLPEVACAIDGQGVNIYNVGSTRLTTSYAISPQSTVTCPPCSIKTHALESQSHSRHTYVSTRGPRARILCFEEETPTKGVLSKISTYSINPANSTPIVSLSTEILDAREAGIGEKCLVLSIHQDGTISCYDRHLESLLWSESLEKPASGFGASNAPQTLYAASLSMEQARKSLLSRREDLLTLGTLASDNWGNSLLFTISTTPLLQEKSRHPSVKVKLCSLADLVNASDPSNSQLHLKELFSYSLPMPDSFRGQQSRFSLHAGSSTLYQETVDCVASYHLNDASPRLSHILPCSNSQLYSSLRISSNLLLTLKDKTLNLFNLPYCSLRASIDLNSARGRSLSTSTKSRTKDRSTHRMPQLLVYSVKHKVALVYFNSNIVAIPVLEEAAKQVSRKRKRPGLLLDSLGQGFAVQDSPCGDGNRSSNSGQVKYDLALAVSEERLQEMIKRGDSSAFDKCMLSEIESMGRRQFLANPHRVSFILSNIFRSQGPTSTGNEGSRAFINLTICFWPSRTVGLLLEEALLTVDRIESALRRFAHIPLITKLDPMALIDAVVKWDNSLALLHTILESSSPLSTLEHTRALVASSRANQNTTHVQETRLLTNAEEAKSKDGETEMALITTAPPAHETASSTESRSNNGNAIRQNVMTLALQRCSTAPSTSLTKAFKCSSSKPQLRNLLDHLRIMVAQHGWLSPYDFSFDDLSKEPAANNQLVIIAHVLNSILDALGPAGWMLGARSQTEATVDPADTLSYMQAEVSAALEGIEEAMYLKGVLGEMLLCGKEALKPESRRPLTDNAGSRQQLVKPTTVTLEKEDPLLPLGLKLKQPIPLTKVGAGGEIIQRSARDIGRLKSRMVGKYSFERIVI